MKNLLSDIPEQFKEEIVEELLESESVRIERIVSKGHRSPEAGWYDQNENEWVAVLEGSGRIAYEDGSEIVLEKGDSLNIPKRTKHRVVWTDPDQPTIWLAVFY